MQVQLLLNSYTKIMPLDSFLLTDADYTVCLDALAGSSNMYLHVSRPPKEGTKAENLVQIMNQVLIMRKLDKMHKKFH